MRCPYCDALISSRRSGKCGVCAKDLPEGFLFSNEQKAKIEAQMKQSAEDFRASMEHLDRVTAHAQAHGPI